VTCIIIFLDEERFLREAIESVLAQTFSDFELLLVDDGSTDASGSIARAYAEADPGRIRYLAHPGGANRGMSASRNLGLANARGEFVAFLDGDDTWLPDKLSAQRMLATQYPQAGMICGATVYWHGWEGGDAEQADNVRHVGAPADTLFDPPELMTRLYPLGSGASPSMSGLIVRRDVLQAIGGFEDRFRGLYEDQAFKVKLYLAAPVYVSSLCFDRYRQHPSSCVQLAASSGRREAIRGEFLGWLRGYLSAHPPTDPEIMRRLNRASLRYRYPRVHRAVHALRGLARSIGGVAGR
jgi:glycosyltransferase involved in cell wall biosynthesis